MSEDVGKALKYALKLLSYRGRSKSELSVRLRMKGFDPADIGSVMERLEQSGYIDDDAWARTLKRRAAKVKLLGRRGAGMYLRQMGIPNDTAGEALKDYDEEASAMKLVENRRRALKDLPRAVAKRRLSAQLRRRGYSVGTARRVLESFNGNKARQ